MTSGSSFCDCSGSGIAVKTNCRSADQGVRCVFHLSNCVGDRFGAVDSTVQDFLFIRVTPAVIANSGTGKMDHSVNVTEITDESGVWFPAHFLCCDWVPSHELNHLVLRSTQLRKQLRPDESASPRDCDAHSYRPSSASNEASSNRTFMVERKRAASAPSTSRWS